MTKARRIGEFQVILPMALNIFLAGCWVPFFQNPGKVKSRADSEKMSLLQQPLQNLGAIELLVGETLCAMEQSPGILCVLGLAGALLETRA